ncbi:hypothetical protein MKleb_5875 (plasmid) [Klebsiella sp. PL-2018]|nr:hypothetical protein MKleb_5875 [Klebsiella sp. PL-2018]
MGYLFRIELVLMQQSPARYERFQGRVALFSVAGTGDQQKREK